MTMNIQALNAEIQHLLSNKNFKTSFQLNQHNSPLTSLLDKTKHKLKPMASLARTNPIRHEGTTRRNLSYQ